MAHSPHRFSVAPMMDWTNRHTRFFHRLLTRHALLYTEMVTTGALIHGPRAQLLTHDAAEYPVALQLGGSDPAALAECARFGADAGYQEINLNVGCPSDRVQNGSFGACLMKSPDLVADCVAAMIAAVDIPVTVKCRIGVDDQVPADVLPAFIDRVADAGCRTFIVHARMAWLEGLSPKQNRDIPPLDYDLVRRVAADRHGLTFVLNGGLADIESASREISGLDGVMLGRAAYHTPGILRRVDGVFFDDQENVMTIDSVIDAMCDYIDRHQAGGGRFIDVSRHMLGLAHQCHGARRWRQILSEQGRAPSADSSLLRQAAQQVDWSRFTQAGDQRNVA